MKKPRARTGWTVYILRCADGSLYTGVTRDITRRIDEHNSNGRLAARYTRSRRPVMLVYQEAARSRATACRREYRIKQLSRSEKLILIRARKKANG
jgi:putative endonuclease